MSNKRKQPYIDEKLKDKNIIWKDPFGYVFKSSRNTEWAKMCKIEEVDQQVGIILKKVLNDSLQTLIFIEESLDAKEVSNGCDFLNERLHLESAKDGLMKLFLFNFNELMIFKGFFEIKKNEDRQRWEFTPNEGVESISYTVSFFEARKEENAWLVLGRQSEVLKLQLHKD